MNQKTAAVVVDLQGDFTTLKQGSLAVDQADRTYVDTVIDCVKKLKKKGLPIIATQDWHPLNHISFFTNTPGKQVFETIQVPGADPDNDPERPQILWPPHCVQETENAKLLLKDELVDEVVKKGTDSRYDSYSGFFDDGGKETGLEHTLKNRDITHLVIFGLATDYCVKATAMDGHRLGFNVTVVEGLCRGVAPDTTKAALKEMKAAGIKVMPKLPQDLSKML